jgi:hypothetical protein
MNDDPILATLLKVLYPKQLSAAMNSLKINKAVRNSTLAINANYYNVKQFN